MSEGTCPSNEVFLCFGTALLKKIATNEKESDWVGAELSIPSPRPLSGEEPPCGSRSWPYLMYITPPNQLHDKDFHSILFLPQQEPATCWKMRSHPTWFESGNIQFGDRPDTLHCRMMKAPLSQVSICLLESKGCISWWWLPAESLSSEQLDIHNPSQWVSSLPLWRAGDHSDAKLGVSIIPRCFKASLAQQASTGSLCSPSHTPVPNLD